MSWHKSIVTVLALAAFIISTYVFFKGYEDKMNSTLVDEETKIYDSVLGRGEIRVGYLVLPPFLDKNSSTGEFSGIFYDFMEEIGRRLELEVKWVEEVNLANMSVGLDSGRYDMVAFPLWRNVARAKTMSFSPPLFYTALGTYVRADDDRFDNDLSLLNAEKVRVSTIDGEVAEAIAREDFPAAKHVALPQFSDYSQLLLQVQTGKADVTFFDKVFAQEYLAKNPGKLKDISVDQPIRVFAQTFILPKDDYKFQTMIGVTATVLVENGVLDRLFRKYGQDLSSFYKPAVPYIVPPWTKTN